MKVYKGIAALEKVPNGSVVTIGNFDGVHRGHREILRRAAERSRQLQLPAIAITFRPHPHIALHPVGDAHLLNSYEEKLELLSDLGLDMVVEEPFSREFSNTSPQDFFQHYLVDKLKVKTLILGYDFSFGKERAGSLDVMQELAKKAGVEVVVVPPQKIGEKAISSSQIRMALEGGEMEWVNAALGRPFFVRGIVRKGDGRGRKIGFPTANLDLKLRRFPRLGVYASSTLWRGKEFASITNVGRNPTFTGGAMEVPVMVETHIFQFNHDIYGDEIEVSFRAFLRDEKKFSGVEELVSQIKKDVEKAKGGI